MLFILLLIINDVTTKSIFNYPCTTNNDCRNHITHSRCFNNKCVCQRGNKSDGFLRCTYEFRYRRQINFGVRMLGEECLSDDECRRTPVDGAKVCLLNRCECSSGHVPIDAYRCIRDFEQLPSNTRVIKSSDKQEPPGYGSICLTNDDCQHSTVQLECLRGTCVCLEGYVPLGKYLCYNIHGHDAPITRSSVVTTFLSTTTSTFDPPNDELVKSLGKLGNICTNDYYCRQAVSQSHCYNGKCSCIDGYISVDQFICMKDTNQVLTTASAHYKSLLGGQCSTDKNCHTRGAVCLINVCTCPNGFFPVDDWNCLPDSDSINDGLTKSMITTTTSFLWWPWSSSSSSTTTERSLVDMKKSLPVRCVLNRQCVSMDSHSHCTAFGRCVCNIGYDLELINNERRCIRKIIKEDDCD